MRRRRGCKLDSGGKEGVLRGSITQFSPMARIYATRILEISTSPAFPYSAQRMDRTHRLPTQGLPTQARQKCPIRIASHQFSLDFFPYWHVLRRRSPGSPGHRKRGI